MLRCSFVYCTPQVALAGQLVEFTADDKLHKVFEAVKVGCKLVMAMREFSKLGDDVGSRLAKDDKLKLLGQVVALASVLRELATDAVRSYLVEAATADPFVQILDQAQKLLSIASTTRMEMLVEEGKEALGKLASRCLGGSEPGISWLGDTDPEDLDAIMKTADSTLMKQDGKELVRLVEIASTKKQLIDKAVEFFGLKTNEVSEQLGIKIAEARVTEITAMVVLRLETLKMPSQKVQLRRAVVEHFKQAEKYNIDMSKLPFALHQRALVVKRIT